MSDELKTLVNEFFRLLDIEEETDDGRVFRPNQLGGSCRAADGEKLNRILARMKELANVD